MRHFNFAEATVRKIRTKGYIEFALETGHIVKVQAPKVALRSKEGDRFVCSWLAQAPRAKPPKLLDPQGVEKYNRWLRDTAYQPRFASEAHTPARLAETWFVERLRAAGVRAEQATAFEDEALGTDLWALLYIHEIHPRWVWYPIDVTFQLLTYQTRLTGKFWKAIERGVIPIGLDPRTANMLPDVALKLLLSGIKTAMSHMDRRRIRLLTREYAFAEELYVLSMGR